MTDCCSGASLFGAGFVAGGASTVPPPPPEIPTGATIFVSKDNSNSKDPPDRPIGSSIFDANMPFVTPDAAITAAESYIAANPGETIAIYVQKGLTAYTGPKLIWTIDYSFFPDEGAIGFILQSSTKWERGLRVVGAGDSGRVIVGGGEWTTADVQCIDVDFSAVISGQVQIINDTKLISRWEVASDASAIKLNNAALQIGDNVEAQVARDVAGGVLTTAVLEIAGGTFPNIEGVFRKSQVFSADPEDSQYHLWDRTTASNTRASFSCEEMGIQYSPAAASPTADKTFGLVKMGSGSNAQIDISGVVKFLVPDYGLGELILFDGNPGGDSQLACNVECIFDRRVPYVKPPLDQVFVADLPVATATVRGSVLWINLDLPNNETSGTAGTVKIFHRSAQSGQESAPYLEDRVVVTSTEAGTDINVTPPVQLTYQAIQYPPSPRTPDPDIFDLTDLDSPILLKDGHYLLEKYTRTVAGAGVGAICCVKTEFSVDAVFGFGIFHDDFLANAPGSMYGAQEIHVTTAPVTVEIYGSSGALPPAGPSCDLVAGGWYRITYLGER